MTTNVQERLQPLRNTLLALHKSLVDSERVSYEQTIGPIKSPNQFLQLLTTDPWFAWLQPFSQLIVAMDVALEEKEPWNKSVLPLRTAGTPSLHRRPAMQQRTIARLCVGATRQTASSASRCSGPNTSPGRHAATFASASRASRALPVTSNHAATAAALRE